jgi:hypothetical protein
MRILEFEELVAVLARVTGAAQSQYFHQARGIIKILLVSVQKGQYECKGEINEEYLR